MTAVTFDHSARRGRQAEPAHRRTHAKVRRNSQAAGREKWGHFSWAQGRRLLLALRIHSEKQRRKGDRTGAAPRSPGDAGGISFGAIRLAEILVAIAAKGRGRLEPSVEWLAWKLNVPAKSIHAWKAQLKRHGFLDWRRRWVETGQEGVRGPQVIQTSNAYWLKIPLPALAAAEKALDKGHPASTAVERLQNQSPKMIEAIAALDRAAARRAEVDAARYPGRRLVGT